VKPEEKQHILDMSEQEFLDAVLARFGRRAGKFQKVSQRVSYPMVASERQQIVSGRVALIGNAAHSLHPIAGQGFNLGLRDIASLTEILAQQLVQPADLGDTKALMRYQAFRQRDIQRTAMFTDQLVKQFSTNSLPHAALRNIGLLAVDRLPSLKQHLMRKLMGVTGQQFKLLTGKPLI
jgi:2-octaprenyl-6-methoxyphenol hydroxylase